VEAMELNRSLRTEADGEEVAAQRSEEDAANSGLDILSKVEQSRNMLARPTGINDMVVNMF